MKIILSVVTSTRKGNARIFSNILALKSFTEYMGNLKTMFKNNFHERKLQVVFQNVHQSKMIAQDCAIKMEYSRKHNINPINEK